MTAASAIKAESVIVSLSNGGGNVVAAATVVVGNGRGVAKNDSDDAEEEVPIPLANRVATPTSKLTTAKTTTW